MKRLLLFFGLITGCVGLSYGMDKAQQRAYLDQIDLDAFTKQVNEKDWKQIARRLSISDARLAVSIGLRQKCEDILVNTDIKDLNVIGQDGTGLFEALMDEYAHENGFSVEERFIRPLLKKLMVKGLDFKAKKDGHYAYKYVASINAELKTRAGKFWQLFDEMKQEKPDVIKALSVGFEDEIAAREAGIKKQQNDHAAREAQKVFNKKLEAATKYLCIGSIVVLLAYVGYQKYVQYCDEEQEDEDEQAMQEATSIPQANG